MSFLNITCNCFAFDRAVIKDLHFKSLRASEDEENCERGNADSIEERLIVLRHGLEIIHSILKSIFASLI